MSDSMAVDPDPAPDNAGWCSIKVTQVIDPMNFYAMIGTGMCRLLLILNELLHYKTNYLYIV